MESGLISTVTLFKLTQALKTLKFPRLSKCKIEKNVQNVVSMFIVEQKVLFVLNSFETNDFTTLFDPQTLQ